MAVGIAIEFPVHPIQETGKRPTAGLDRNLAYLRLVEILFNYPLDGVVLTISCDKTTPTCLMACPGTITDRWFDYLMEKEGRRSIRRPFSCFPAQRQCCLFHRHDRDRFSRQIEHQLASHDLA